MNQKSMISAIIISHIIVVHSYAKDILLQEQSDIAVSTIISSLIVPSSAMSMEKILTHKELKNIDLSGQDLRNVNFAGWVLYKVNFTGANLTGAQFQDVKGMSECIFKNANLTKANLRGVNAIRGDFTNANLTYAQLQGADLTQSLVDGAIFKHANLNSAILHELLFIHKKDSTPPDFSYANMSSAICTKAVLSRACFIKAVCDKADFTDSTLDHIDATGCSFFHVTAIGTDFSFADFSSADLRYANFSQSNFKGADMTNVLSYYTNISQACMVDAIVIDAFDNDKNYIIKPS